MNIAAILKLLNLVPSWVYALLLTGLSAAYGYQFLQLSAKDVQLTLAKAKVSTVQADHDRAVLDGTKALAKHNEEKLLIVTNHAQTQQGLTDEFTKTIGAIFARDVVRLNDSKRVRDGLTTIAPVDSRTGQIDQATCIRFRDRLVASRQLLAEGYDLVGESETIIRKRNAEVTLLKGLLNNDRNAHQ